LKELRGFKKTSRRVHSQCTLIFLFILSYIIIIIRNFQKIVDLWRAMKNDECTIYIMKGDRCINMFRKDNISWNLTIANGRMFPCTCEQMVSHLLPALAYGNKKGLVVKVVPDEKQ
jgi:hypothetical protein